MSLPPCDDNVFRNGSVVAVLGDYPKERVEWFCQETARRTGEAVDWHYAAGRAQVLTTGKPREVEAVFRDVMEGVAPEGCLLAKDEESR